MQCCVSGHVFCVYIIDDRRSSNHLKSGRWLSADCGMKSGGGGIQELFDEWNAITLQKSLSAFLLGNRLLMTQRLEAWEVQLSDF